MNRLLNMNSTGLEQAHAEARVRVRYAETDQMGVVYHANYLVWFEIGRVELMRKVGIDYRNMEQEEGALIAVVDASVRYRAPARYDDQLVIRTRLAGVRGGIVRFRYEIVREADGLLLCEGETVHMVVGRDMKRRAMPQKYAERFAELQHRMEQEHGRQESGSRQRSQQRDWPGNCASVGRIGIYGTARRS